MDGLCDVLDICVFLSQQVHLLEIYHAEMSTICAVVRRKGYCRCMLNEFQDVQVTLGSVVVNGCGVGHGGVIRPR